MGQYILLYIVMFSIIFVKMALQKFQVHIAILNMKLKREPIPLWVTP